MKTSDLSQVVNLILDGPSVSGTKSAVKFVILFLYYCLLDIATLVLVIFYAFFTGVAQVFESIGGVIEGLISKLDREE